jgi:hypothetical protein
VALTGSRRRDPVLAAAAAAEKVCIDLKYPDFFPATTIFVSFPIPIYFSALEKTSRETTFRSTPIRLETINKL